MLRFITIFWLYLLPYLLAVEFVQANSLEFVQVFFRHGQRTPTKFLTFPTDSPGIDANIAFERGELTTTGMWQEYWLGSNLREAYASLLNYTYRPSELRVFTGLDNRTTTSALLALASFMPPVDDQVWNPALKWQPIPTVTEEIIDHVSFGVFDHCDVLKQKIINGNEYGKLFNSFANLTEFLAAKSGVDIPDLFVLQRVIDGVISRDGIRKLIPFPKWADDRNFLQYLRQQQYKMHIKFMSLFLEEIGGWHYDQIVGAMDNFLNNRSSHKVVMFSGHDTNAVTISRFLKIDVDWNTLPDFASFLSFELHKYDHEYFIKIFFHNKLNATTREVFLEDCPHPCPFAKFANLYDRTSTAEWMAICKRGMETNCPFYQTLAGVLAVITILLAAFFVSAFWSCLSYKKKYLILNDSERKPLL